MYTKTIKYTDFRGKEREKTYYFNLTQQELVEMQSSVDGGLDEYGKRIIESQNVPEVMALFKKLILKSYGEISPDGDRFIKVDPVRGNLADEFAQTNAFSQLYMEFLEHPEAGADFFNQVIPAEVREMAEKNDGHAYPPSVAKA
jgi:hypothetical protein